jgi:hypothetical protein
MMRIVRLLLLFLIFVGAHTVTKESVLHYRCYKSIMQWADLAKTPYNSTKACVSIYKQLGDSP